MRKLSKFLIHYNTNRKYGGVKKLKVRTPCEAVKGWFEIEPQNFKILLDEFCATLLKGMVQRGETWHLNKNLLSHITLKPL